MVVLLEASVDGLAPNAARRVGNRIMSVFVRNYYNCDYNYNYNYIARPNNHASKLNRYNLLKEHVRLT